MEDEGIEHEWLVFTASVADAAAANCGFRAMCASRGGNPRTAWWMPEIREDVRLKKKAFRVLLTQTAAGYHRPGGGQLRL